ncbi:hypothetical protein LQK89_14805 [Curtobacterium sp. C1]|uniref:hypothetical protein n=1 Tax=Curtobacterium sp. C1 TaxID=2898151 RepID=UPI001E4A6A25|nr:hypothetical protein [Curtobacterium sp. C1]UFU13759.1 hypothetical protein LQK89_14805 [Curtobacterium sp. C1]
MIAVGAAFVLGLSQVSLSVVLLNLAIAVAGAGVLAFIGSGRAIAGMVLLFFLGPVLTRFVLDGAQISVRVWFPGIVAGWVLGALVRRVQDRGLPASGVAERPVLHWWVRGRHYEERDPTLEQVEAKVRALDGRDRTLVIMHDGARELDICGDAATGIIVFRTEDSGDESRWGVPLGAEVDDDDRAETAMGDVSAPVARGLLVDAREASSIAREFHGGRSVAGPAGTLRGQAVMSVRPSLP